MAQSGRQPRSSCSLYAEAPELGSCSTKPSTLTDGEFFRRLVTPKTRWEIVESGGAGDSRRTDGQESCHTQGASISLALGSTRNGPALDLILTDQANAETFKERRRRGAAVQRERLREPKSGQLLPSIWKMKTISAMDIFTAELACQRRCIVKEHQRTLHKTRPVDKAIFITSRLPSQVVVLFRRLRSMFQRPNPRTAARREQGVAGEPQRVSLLDDARLKELDTLLYG